MSFDASTLTNLPLKYETTDDSSGGRRGGIWQGAAGPAAGVDSSTGSVNIFFSTGDGDFNVDGSGGKNAGNSFVKLTTTLAIPGGTYSSSNYFTPSDQCYRYYADLDYGSGGVILLPDGTLPNYPYIALKGEKLNYLWVMDRANPGGFHAGGCTRQTDCSPNNGTVISPCDQINWANGNTQVIKATTGLNETRHSPAFWSGNTSSFVKGWVFFASGEDVMKAYAVATSCTIANGGGNGPVLCNPAFEGTRPLGYAATPSVSSNGSSNGIVWAIKGTTGPDYGLYAFDATNLNELWNTRMCVDINGNRRDEAGQSTKFDVPTVANGYIYMGTKTDFDIYGQVPQRTCTVGH